MISNENKPNATRNGVGKDPVLHGDRNAQEGTAFVNSQPLRELAGFIGPDKLINRLPAFKLKRLIQPRIAFIKAFCKLNIHYLPAKRSRCLRASLRLCTRVTGSF